MKKTTSFLFTIAFICFSTINLFSQDFLKNLEYDDNITYKDLQKEFYNWSKTKNLEETKGWKYYKRWEDFNNKRASADGTLPDPEVYYNEVKKINEQRISAQKNSNDNYTWTPVGLMTEALTYSEWLETGIGRINCITFHPSDSNIFWVGVAQGGVWKTIDHGYSWIPLTDELPMLRISDICVDPNNPETIYISVCDYAYISAGLLLDDRKRNTHYGLGVYKTTNGGQSWEPTGLSFEQTDFDASLTRRVFIDEEDANHLLAAGTHGIWKSIDAGDTWAQVSEDLIWDIERDPQNPNTIYASTGFVRKLDEGQCGIIKSYDFGNTWEELEIEIPPRDAAQRIELAISTTDSNYVYAVACDLYGGLYGFYQTTNAGEAWTLKSSYPNILEWYSGNGNGGQGTYDLAIIIDPTDNERVFVGGVNVWGSDDGGSTWDGVTYWQNVLGPSIHADQHFFAINPLDTNYYICNDGGLYRTKEIEIGSWYDAYNQNNYEWPTEWERLNNGLMVTSFYRLGLSKNNDGYVVGGTQDNSTFYNNTEDWYNIFGGDGMECIIHPDDPSIVYGSSQYGSLYKTTDGGQDYDYISNDIDEDGEWTTPFVMDHENPDIIYAGYGNVYKTINGGNSWSKISNFPIMTGFGQPNLCSSIAVSENNNDYMYVAKRFYHSFDEPASVWKTFNGGSNWVDITSNLPDSIYFTYIATDDQSTNTAWITCGGFYEGLKVFKTINGGNIWENISYNLPNLPVNCIVEEHGKEYNPVYVGMDVGIYYINDTMTNWVLFNNELPNVIVSELEIHEATNKIYAATFGRGIWKTDLYIPVADTTSITNNPVYNTFMEIFPNPTSGKFELKIENSLLDFADIKIIDVTGKQVYNESYEIQNNYRESFDLNLMPGMYYLILSSEKYSKSVKFVVQ